MNVILNNSFIPEIFLSISILIQLIYNVRFINNVKLRYPIISLEVYNQTLFVLAILGSLYFISEINTFLISLSFINNKGVYFFKLILVLLAFFLLIIIKPTFSLQKINFPEFLSLYLLSLLALLTMISAESLLSFYLVMEMQALCFYILASFNRRSIFSAEAGLKYFVSGSVISGFYLLGVSCIYGVLGTVDLVSIKMLLFTNFEQLFSPIWFSVLFLGILLVIFTLLFKLACAPFHWWVPDVYQGSPISSTAIFSILPKLSLICFFFKFLIAVEMFSSKISIILLVCGLLSAFIGAFYAFNSKKLKLLIIYSSIAQTGLLAVGLSLFSFNGMVVTLFFTFIYLLTSILVWHFLISFSYSVNKFNIFNNKNFSTLYLTDLVNLISVHKPYAAIFLILFFSMSGIPFFIGFLSKMMVLSELVQSGNFFSTVLLLVFGAVSAFYYLRINKVAFVEISAVNTYVHTERALISFFEDDPSLRYSYISFISVLLTILFFSPVLLILLCHYLLLSFHLI